MDYRDMVLEMLYRIALLSNESRQWVQHAGFDQSDVYITEVLSDFSPPM